MLKSIMSKSFLVLMLSVLLFVGIALILPDVSHAAVKVEDTLCRAIEMITGTVGKAIAVIIILSVAFMMFLGKITWGVAIAVGVGMGLLFGAETVVGTLSGDNAVICENVANN